MTILCQVAALEDKKLKERVQKLILKHPLSSDVLKQLSAAQTREQDSIYCLLTLCRVSLLCTILASVTTSS
jgi:hypothetical protein